MRVRKKPVPTADSLEHIKNLYSSFLQAIKAHRSDRSKVSYASNVFTKTQTLVAALVWDWLGQGWAFSKIQFLPLKKKIQVGRGDDDKSNQSRYGCTEKHISAHTACPRRHTKLNPLILKIACKIFFNSLSTQNYLC